MIGTPLIAGLVSLLALLPAGTATADLGPAPARPVAASEWPEMREFALRAAVRLDVPRVDIDVPFYDRGGAVRYRLICRGGSQAHLDDVSERTGTAGYLPDLTCILNAGDRESDASLLSEDESAAYYSRGRFALSELAGACARYPEYGLVRHFRLRGMELELSVSGLAIAASGAAAGRPAHALLGVSVRRDPSARTAKAEQPGYLRPGGTAACRTVRRGNGPRMCRDAATSSWTQCSPAWEYVPYPWEDRARRSAAPRRVSSSRSDRAGQGSNLYSQ